MRGCRGHRVGGRRGGRWYVQRDVVEARGGPDGRLLAIPIGAPASGVGQHGGGGREVEAGGQRVGLVSRGRRGHEEAAARTEGVLATVGITLVRTGYAEKIVHAINLDREKKRERNEQD